MTDTTRIISTQLTRSCLLGSANMDWIETLLTNHLGLRFGRTMYQRVQQLRKLMADQHAVRVQDAIDACTAALEQAIYLKFVSIQLIETLDQLTGEPVGPARSQATEQLHQTQTQIAFRLRFAQEDLSHALRELDLKLSVQREAVDMGTVAPAPSAPPAAALADAGPALSDEAIQAVHMSLESAALALGSGPTFVAAR